MSKSCNVVALSAMCVFVFFYLLPRLKRFFVCHSHGAVNAKRSPVSDHDAKAGDESMAGNASCARALSRPIKVVMLHLDLGIGGAERLVLDAALGLEKYQSVAPINVTMVTSALRPDCAFAEALDGRVKVIVRGSCIPHVILGRARALCSVVRMVYMAVMTCWSMPDTDCYMVDQVALCMPVLKCFAPFTPILFYCHFPDKMCDNNRTRAGEYKSDVIVSPFHRIYRSFLDWLEEWSMSFATRIVYNSKYTKSCVLSAFPKLSVSQTPVSDDVVYPCVDLPDTASTDKRDRNNSTCGSHNGVVRSSGSADALISGNRSIAMKDKIVFVSINRFHREKNIELAIDAFALLRQRLLTTHNGVNHAGDNVYTDSTSSCSGTHGGDSHTSVNPNQLILIVAGGCDANLPENMAYYHELTTLAYVKHSLPRESVVFMCNISNAEKQTLLQSMRALVYTAGMEHFGIGPLEAMQHGRPVVAVACGGPCESVGLLEETTSWNDVNDVDAGNRAGGILCEATTEAFADAMERFACDSELADRVGLYGKARVAHRFHINLFATTLANHVIQLC